MQSASVIVVLGTGGTIAGTASDADDDLGYTAAQLGVAQLLKALPGLAISPIEVEQLAQIDSKDMDFELWRLLARSISAHLARAEVAAVVVTHGTDTMEETAYLLQRVLAPTKPVVLVGAMRPSTSAHADGPQNLLDAFTLARHVGAAGVLAVLAGTVHSGMDLRKRHTARVDAFESSDAGPVAVIVEGQLEVRRDWPRGEPLGLDLLADETPWPDVEIVTSVAGSRATVVDALRQIGVRGIVVAGTGNGSVHHALEEALVRAQDAGIAVWRSSRCGGGSVVDAAPARIPSAGALTPPQARIELMLRLMGAAPAR